MDKTIPHRELRNNSSAVLREVQSGATIRITNHGEVVAIMTPPAATPGSDVRMRRASVRGGFDQLEPIEIDTPSQQIIDELRGER